MFRGGDLERRGLGIGGYEVDREGTVWSRGMPLNPVRGTWVSIAGERRYVCYLVARAFVPNPEGRPFVRHRNGDPRDNRAENLEWSEVKEEPRRGRKPALRQIGMFDGDGNLVARFWNVPEAALAAGLRTSAVRDALRRKGKCGGWTWMYL